MQKLIIVVYYSALYNNREEERKASPEVEWTEDNDTFKGKGSKNIG